MSTEPRRKSPLLMGVIVVLAVAVPFSAWYFSWLGRPLTDEQVREYLDSGDAQKVQHALVQLQARMARKDPAAASFREQVLALTAHREAGVRRMTAWVLGHDAHESCHKALKLLVQDPDLATRRNAAVALSNWNDPAGRDVLLAALRPVEIRAPAAGELELKVEVGSAVGMGRDMARILQPGTGEVALRPPMNGRVATVAKQDGEAVVEGDLIGTLSPDPESVYAALRALYIVGRKEDREAVRPYVDGALAEMPEKVLQQARLTLDKLGR